MGGQSDLDIFRIHRTFNLRYIQNRVGEKIYQSLLGNRYETVLWIRIKIKIGPVFRTFVNPDSYPNADPDPHR